MLTHQLDSAAKADFRSHTISSDQRFPTGHRPAFHAALLAPRYWSTWLIVLGLAALGLLPLRVVAWLADIVTSVGRALLANRAHVAIRNLELCFQELTPAARTAIFNEHARILAHVYLSFGRLVSHPTTDLNRRFIVSGQAHLQQQIDAGRNIILLTPHTIAMEMAGHWLAENYDIATVVRVHEGNALLDWLVSRLRTRRALIFSHTTNLLPLIKAVRGGRHLFYLPDDDNGDAQAGAENTLFVPLFGVPKATPASLGRLAKACAAAVIPTATGYDPDTRHYHVEFLPALANFPSGDPLSDATSMNAAIEMLVRRDPRQYMWSAKIFRTRPPGAAKRYK